MWSIIDTALFGMVLASTVQTTGIKVTYVSKSGSANLGITPLTIVYTPPEARPDCFFGNEIKITWFSGVHHDRDHLRFFLLLGVQSLSKQDATRLRRPRAGTTERGPHRRRDSSQSRATD